MKISSFALIALVGCLARAEEEFNMDMEMENTIINSIKDQVGDSGKFYSYKAHLGKPAMHPELLDGKQICQQSCFDQITLAIPSS